MKILPAVIALIMSSLSQLCEGANHSVQETDRKERIECFEDLASYAKTLSIQAAPAIPKLPESISNLTYDDYRMIAFRADQAVWWNESKPYWFELFHRGFVHRNRVNINVIQQRSNTERTCEVRVPFDPEMFEYRGPLAGREVPEETGFAGVKVVGRFPNRDDGQEMLTFLGASYFRARTADTVYGSSARGLAIDTGTDHEEEFPAFTDFWIVEPEGTDERLTVLALLNSDSVVGAYQFELNPGTNSTDVDVKARLYFRNSDCKVGMAPLTSMWMWGDGIDPPPLEHRPSVHDADGLLIDRGQEGQIWRALSRQSYPSLSRIDVQELHGFGLMQRERRYIRYHDHEAQYHRRPSLWVQPKTPWKDGAVELLELPAPHEGHDNIAAYWVPNGPVKVGEPVDLEYQVNFTSKGFVGKKSLARAVKSTYERNDDGTLNVRIQFRGRAIAELDESAPVSVDLMTIRGEVLQQFCEKYKSNCTVELKIAPSSEEAPVEIQVHLKDQTRTLSETWSTLCSHEVPAYQFPQVYTRND